MRVLIVCSGNAGYTSPFVTEQVEAIQNLGVEIQIKIFSIIGKGVFGYLKNIVKLKKEIQDYKPDIIHAHYGLSGLLAVIQRKIPVIITFHGSDAYIIKIQSLSKAAASLSRFNIFVSDKIRKIIDGKKKFEIIPCGINLEVFYPGDMKIARENLKMDLTKKYVLFSSGFSNVVKNSPLAFSAIEKLGLSIELVELKNRSREEVNLLLNACNLLLLTSFSEGSPQIIKEAMACNCPIVATDVGDIKEVIGNTKGCYITSYDPDDVAENIKQALNFNKRTEGREKVKRFDNKHIAEKIYNVYKMVISNP